MNVKDAVLEVIKNRKSVRSFVSGQEIPKEDVVAMIKAGMAAPTSKNSQPWTFMVIDDPVMIDKVATNTPYIGMLKDCSLGIMLVAEPMRSPPEAPDSWIQDLAAASENILLAVEAMGYGACWIQLYNIPKRMEDFKELFSLPDQVVPFNVLCIGKPTGFDAPQDKWNEQKVMWNKWERKI